MLGRNKRCALAVLLVLAAVPARAEDREAARAAYLEASKHYDLMQYADALEAFKRAYWNFEDPVILYNIAQCHRALRNKGEAIDFYRSYLRKAPAAKNRETVLRILAELESAAERDKAVSSAAPEGPLEPKPSPAPEAPVVRAQEVAPPPAAPATAAKPLWKRAWLWGVVGAVVASGVAVGVGVGLGAQPHPPRAADGVVSF